MKPSTSDQRFYESDGRMKAEIDVCLTHEYGNVPSINECRFAVLPIRNKGNGYVTYDRLLNRIVNGVYYGSLESALESAAHYNEDPGAPQDMAPNGAALNLKYPKPHK